MPEVSWWRSLRERMEVLPVEPWQLLAAAVAVVVLAVGGVGWAVASAGGAGPPVESTLPRAGDSGSASSSTSVVAVEVVVHVAGAVARPGLYRLPGGSRLADAVAAAGAATADADLDRVNLAAPVADGERVYVPRRGEAEPPGVEAAPAGAPSRLNLNTATVQQLEALPGVGPATARAIVDHRTRHGRFRSVRDLLDVRGIGEAKLAALEELVHT